MSLRRRLDLDVNGDGLTNSRHTFRRLREHQIEVATLERIRRHAPTRSLAVSR